MFLKPKTDDAFHLDVYTDAYIAKKCGDGAREGFIISFVRET